jgi:hypothetical protein
MISIRWIFPAVFLVFAVALLPRAFVAPGFSKPGKAAIESYAQYKLQDRFLPGGPQHDQLMSLPEPEHKATVALGHDLTGNVQPVTSATPTNDGNAPSAIEYPAAHPSAQRPPNPAKHESRTKTAVNRERDTTQTKLGKQQPKPARVVDNVTREQEGQIPAPNFTFSAY